MKNVTGTFSMGRIMHVKYKEEGDIQTGRK